MKEYIVSENSYEYEMRRYDELRELIRCKDCKFWEITIYENIETCPKHRNANGWEQATDPEDFCSWAEKRKE